VKQIVLASASPRRKALLEALGLKFEVVSSDVDEDLEGLPEEVVTANARAKCCAVSEQLLRKRLRFLSRDRLTPVCRELGSPALTIGADTIVVLDGHSMGKPAGLDEARTMLARLSGRTHQVFTGLTVIDSATGRTAEGVEVTDVTFRTLTTDEIDRFVDAVRPTDRAGAYTVDGPGSLLVESYRGCYQNVLGLPIVRLDLLLRELGYSLFTLMDGDRSVFL
jgi:septum formation protein